MKDETIDLANKIGEVLNGHELDNAIPALTMVLSHAVQMSNIPIESIMGFLESAMKVCDDDSTTRH
jgi:CRISPR/Cas system CSM-associated protein Csm2 small subunit